MERAKQRSVIRSKSVTRKAENAEGKIASVRIIVSEKGAPVGVEGHRGTCTYCRVEGFA